MIKTEQKEIDGTLFQVGALDLKSERKLLLRLGKVLGPALAELARAGAGKEDAEPVKAKDVAPAALRALFDGLDEENVEALIETFQDVTKVGMRMANESVSWVPYTDSAFKNGASSQLKWLWFCLEHQCAGFLGSTSGKLDELLGKFLGQEKASGSSSPQT